MLEMLLLMFLMERTKEGLYPSWYYVWDVNAASNRWSKSDEAE